MFNKITIHSFGILLGVLLLGSNLSAKELRVGPASFDWSGVETGKRIPMPAAITIQNKSDQTRYYHLQARTPAEIRLKVKNGFEPIPDTQWISFEEVMVQVPPGGTKKVKMYLFIPKGEKFKKPWMFYVEVKEEISRYGYLKGKPEFFALAGYLKIYLLPK